MKTLLMADDFDRYPSGQYIGVNSGWARGENMWLQTDAPYIFFIRPEPTFGGLASSPPPGKIRYADSAGSNYYGAARLAPVTEAILGQWMYTTAGVGAFAAGGRNFGLGDSALNLRVSLSWDESDGSCDIYDSAGALIASTGAGNFPIGEWFYLEWYVKLAGAASEVALYINDLQVIAPTTFTEPTITEINQFRFGDALQNYAINDFYLLGGTLGDLVPADRLGGVRVDYVGQPDSVGNDNDFTGSDGNSVDNHLLVDALPQSINTAEYVESGTVGHKQNFGFPVAPDLTGRTVVAVGVSHSSIESTGSTRTFRAYEDDGVNELADAAGADEVTGQRERYFHGFLTAPDGTAWDVAKVNAADFGIEVIT